ncbi:hypothetical protein VTI28DRAFT_7799 [Corynascus sepedonium]
MVKLASFVLAAFAGTCVLASPITAVLRDNDEELLKYLTETNPENIVFNPVPGLPTLEELNITVADFFKPEFRAKHGLPDPRNTSPLPAQRARDLLEKRFDPVCYSGDLSTVTHVNGAYACRDYLNSLGTTQCAAYSHLPGTKMCDMVVEYTRVVTYGTPAGSLYSAASHCSDVARGMNWIIDNCRTNNPCHCGVSGANAAWGNGDLIITIKNTF